MDDGAWHSVYGDATVQQASLDDAGWWEGWERHSRKSQSYVQIKVLEDDILVGMRVGEPQFSGEQQGLIRSGSGTDCQIA